MVKVYIVMQEDTHRGFGEVVDSVWSTYSDASRRKEKTSACWIEEHEVQSDTTGGE